MKYQQDTDHACEIIQINYVFGIVYTLIVVSNYCKAQYIYILICGSNYTY